MSNYATGDLFDSFLPITHCSRKSDIAFSVLVWRVFLARLVYQLRHWGCELLFRWLIPGCLRIFTQNGPPKQRGRCAPNLLLSALAPLSIWEARISFQCDYRVASKRQLALTFAVLRIWTPKKSKFRHASLHFLPVQPGISHSPTQKSTAFPFTNLISRIGHDFCSLLCRDGLRFVKFD